jgi:hypothetical protein
VIKQVYLLRLNKSKLFNATFLKNFQSRVSFKLGAWSLELWGDEVV